MLSKHSIFRCVFVAFANLRAPFVLNGARALAIACLSAGVGAPACTQEAPRCESGAESACPCAAGPVGSQRCASDGTFGPCRCPQPPADAATDDGAALGDLPTAELSVAPDVIVPPDLPSPPDVGSDVATDMAADAPTMLPGCPQGDRCDVDGDGRAGSQCGGDDCDDRDCRRFPGNAERCDVDGVDEDCMPCTVAGSSDGDHDRDTYLGSGCHNHYQGAAPACDPRIVTVDRATALVSGRDCADDDNNRHPDQAEICNGVDDNCNDLIDDDFHGGSCGSGLPGACAEGVNECRMGRLTCTPTVAPGTRSETCNAIDDDCDGSVDEDTPGEGAPCLPDGVHEPVRGICRRGAQTCLGGRYVCQGGVTPVHETCNGLDDDCDGVIDQTPFCPRSCTPSFGVGCGMVELSGGSFMLGQIGAVGTNDLVTPITLSPYAMDAYEVTVARFRQFWDSGHPGVTVPVPYPGGSTLAWYQPSYFGFTEAAVREPRIAVNCTWSATAGLLEDRPINGVDYYTSLAFCVWDGGRLPTEAEWEYAARGRAVGGLVAGRTYPWGEEAPSARGAYPCTLARTYCSLIDIYSMGYQIPAPVGSFAPTGGFYDLAGNVSEWTADWGMSYAEDVCWDRIPRTDPFCGRGSSWARGTFPVRGGASDLYYETFGDMSPREAWRSASRLLRSGTEQSRLHGFRCARTR